MGGTWVRGCGAVCAIALAWLAAAPGLAEPAAAPDDAEGARGSAILRASLDRIAGARALRFRIRTEFDVLQRSGELLEFGDERTLTLRRPDRLRVDVQRREGDRLQLTYDGQHGVLFSPDQQAYARVELGETIDAALERLTGELGVPFPLAELLSSDVETSVPNLLGPALYIGRETLDGAACEHLALQGPEADLQVWIAADVPGLPCRVVITYRTEGRPQFRADFVDWSLTPEVPDTLFAFTAPAGATALDVARVSRAAAQDD